VHAHVTLRGEIVTAAIAHVTASRHQENSLQ